MFRRGLTSSLNMMSQTCSLTSPPELLMRRAARPAKQAYGVALCSTSSPQGTFRAAVCTELGKPLQVQNFPRAQLGAGEVRVKVHNAGLNFADVLVVQGKYQEKRELPFIPGVEIAGEVTELGEGVTELKVGNRVVGMSPRGSYTEECVAPAMTLVRVPDSIPYRRAASFLATYGTAWMALKRRANIKEGDTVLVTAAAGGVGLAAVELAANIFKCKVIGACGGPAKCELVKQKGAFATIDYSKESIRDRVKELTNGEGADIIFEVVGGKVFAECLRSIAFEGRILIIGFASGDIPKIPANILMVKSVSAVGVFWGSYSQRYPPAFFESIHSCIQALAEGNITPHTGAAFNLAQANEALEYLSSRKSTGKVVIDCQK